VEKYSDLTHSADNRHRQAKAVAAQSVAFLSSRAEKAADLIRSHHIRLFRALSLFIAAKVMRYLPDLIIVSCSAAGVNTQ
jgi:hypothetical protein